MTVAVSLRGVRSEGWLGETDVEPQGPFRRLPARSDLVTGHAPRPPEASSGHGPALAQDEGFGACAKRVGSLRRDDLELGLVSR